MAVPEQIPVVNYVADGIVKKFDVPFEYDQQSDLHVYVDGAEPTIDKYYFDGNAFNFYIAPTSGQTVKIKRITPKERDTDYNLHTNTVRPKALNTDFDRLWYVLQEVFSDVGGLSQAVQDEIIARIQGDEDLLNQLTAEISARMLGDEAVTEDLKNYINNMIALIIGDPSFNGIDADKINDESGKTQQQVNDEVVSIFRFGAICDGTLHKAQEWLDSGRFSSFAQLQNAYPSAVSVDDSIDTLAMEKALAKIGASGHVRLGGRPVFSRKVILPENANGLRVFANNIIYVQFLNNDGGFQYHGLNQNYGGIVYENIYARGTNTWYPSVGYVAPNTGYGFDHKNAFDITLINSSAFGFYKGYRLEHGFSNKTVGDCRFMFNQIGVEFVGMANVNRFENVKIRENRIGGVVIDGLAVVHPQFGQVYPTKNKFSGYIESNIPYEGGYLSPALDGSNSFGVKLTRTYGNSFSEVYMENQQFDVIMDSQSSYNTFTETRHAPLGGREAKIWLKGAGVNYNTFRNATRVGHNFTSSDIIADTDTQRGNLFVDCIGFNIQESDIIGGVDFINNRRFGVTQSGTNFGAITRYKSGYLNNPNETSGLVGIGTETATLDVNGCGEVLFNNQITAATTITGITGVRKGQILILKNYQISHPVTIKASATGTSGIVLNGRKDCILSNYSDSITFFVSELGRLVEIGRAVQAVASVDQSVGTWTPVVTSSGGSAIATASATGRWVKNGRQLTVWFDIVSSSDLVETNYYRIAGMPNLPQFAQNGAGQVSSATNATNANQKDVFGVDAATTGLTVRVSTQANFSNSDGFAGCATYIIA